MDMTVLASYHIHTDPLANYYSGDDLYRGQEYGVPEFLGAAGGTVLEYHQVRNGRFPGWVDVIRGEQGPADYGGAL